MYRTYADGDIITPDDVEDLRVYTEEAVPWRQLWSSGVEGYGAGSEYSLQNRVHLLWTGEIDYDTPEYVETGLRGKVVWLNTSAYARADRSLQLRWVIYVANTAAGIYGQEVRWALYPAHVNPAQTVVPGNKIDTFDVADAYQPSEFVFSYAAAPLFKTVISDPFPAPPDGRYGAGLNVYVPGAPYVAPNSGGIAWHVQIEGRPG